MDHGFPARARPVTPGAVRQALVIALPLDEDTLEAPAAPLPPRRP